jgi:peptidoglycan/xylan/chitin deacetylase (PgdA/CDA1 family)
MSTLTILMYHYVRRLAQSRYPAIKALERDAFIEQLKYVRRFYTPVTGHQVIEAVKGATRLPSNAILLTFDDGYLDHFETVLPLLVREKMPAVFFPPGRCVMEQRVLDVNKIHYILAAVADKSKIVAAIEAAVAEARAEYSLDSLDSYRQRYAVANRFDPPEVIYIKRMLQVALPTTLRVRITNDLFACWVSADEKTFARELYMDEDQIRSLIDAGMMVGSHGYNHDWLNHLSSADQAADIDRSLEFLRHVGVRTSDWVMCYPYGAWSESVLTLLRARGCALGVTTEPALARMPERDPLLLPRLDTNDLPTDSRAEPVQWTRALE